MELSMINRSTSKVNENNNSPEFIDCPTSEQRGNPFLFKEDDSCNLKPLVSVLLASYNHSLYVKQAIESIVNQKGTVFELIVIDDGSTDESPSIIDSLQKKYGFKYIHRQNKGLIKTMNELLEMAKGKYYCSFASDDIMPEGRLYEQSCFLENHPNKVACFGQIIPMTSEGKIGNSIDPRYLRSCPEITFNELFLGQKALHGCSEMFVLDAIKKIGGYDERFFFEDYPLYLKILYEYGSQPVVSDIICCYYREHSINLHLKNNEIYSTILRILRLYESHPLYSKALLSWKTKWFSALAYSNKFEALKKMYKLMSFSPTFLKHFFKLFIPKFMLKY